MNDFINAVVKTFFIYFNYNHIVHIVAIFIVLFFILWIGVVFIRGYFKPNKEFQNIKRRLNEAINMLPEQDHRNEFVRDYRDIDENFSKEDSVFSYLWKEFNEQLIKPSQEVSVFQNSIRPKEFFTLNHILGQHNINLRWLNSLSGILVGLGVLGTFVGLTFSLMSVVPSLFGEGKDLNKAVETLISGSGVAFITSIAGLFLA